MIQWLQNNFLLLMMKWNLKITHSLGPIVFSNRILLKCLQWDHKEGLLQDSRSSQLVWHWAPKTLYLLMKLESVLELRTREYCLNSKLHSSIKIHSQERIRMWRSLKRPQGTKRFRNLKRGTMTRTLQDLCMDLFLGRMEAVQMKHQTCMMKSAAQF